MVSVARSSRTTLPLESAHRRTTCTVLRVDWIDAAGHSAAHPLAPNELVPHPFGQTLWKFDVPDAVGRPGQRSGYACVLDGPRPPPEPTAPRKESEKNQTTRPSSKCCVWVPSPSVKV
jgi:hypothetical protein